MAASNSNSNSNPHNAADDTDGPCRPPMAPYADVRGGCSPRAAAGAPSCRAPAPAVAPGHGSEPGVAGDENDDPAVALPPFPSSASMEFSFVREEDAYILEQGVEEKRGADWADFDDEGRRLESSGSNASLTEFENEDESAEGEGVDGSVGSQRDHSGLVSVSGPLLDESRNDLSPLYAASSLADESGEKFSSASPLDAPSRIITNFATPSNDDISMPSIAENFICHPPLNTSEDSRPQCDMVDNEPVIEPHADDYFLGSAPPPSPVGPKTKVEIDHEALARRIDSVRVHQRSSSFDRRRRESAQFLAAVGEDPTLVLRKIIEEDSSSDFDDDEIDEEGGKTLVLPQGEGGEELLLDHPEESQNSEGRAEDNASGPPDPEKAEPICVSTDLARMALKEEECSNHPLPHQQGGSPSLVTTPEVGNVDSMETTPEPLPCQTEITQPPCYVDWKFTPQPSSSRHMGGNNTHQNNGIFASSSGEANFAYRGIRANPPEITKRGMARGNYAQLHRKAWLEVSDKHHRYGKNLRMYYKHWEVLGHPYHLFFDWLDSKGEAEGKPLPNLPELPRPVLDSDTVLYITNPEVTATYALGIRADPEDGSGIIVDQDGKLINTGPEGWIFILRDHVLYGSQKVTAPKAAPSSGGEVVSQPRQRFHHSSFFGGKAVASAGIFITNEHGRLTHLYPHSGHYRPGEAHMQRALFFLQRHGVELSMFNVDMQQIFKVSRKMCPKGEDASAAGDKAKGKKEKGKESTAAAENGKQLMKKSKKTDCLHLMGGLEVAYFLAHKAIMIQKGVFHQIHKIRRVPKESRGTVCIVLGFVN